MEKHFENLESLLEQVEIYKGKNIDIDSCLYMRPKGDYRKDFMVKRDLYKRMIVDGFNPVLVFEDKITVVEMWKEMGLKCKASFNNTWKCRSLF